MPYVGRYYENPSAKLWDGVYKNYYKKVEQAFKEGADINVYFSPLWQFCF